MWLSVLLSAGIAVEVCHVAEATTKPPVNKGHKRRKEGTEGWGNGRRDFDGDQEENPEEDEEDEEDDEFKYESGGEGKGEGMLLSHTESVREKRQEATLRDKKRRENSENMDPDDVESFRKEVKREKSTPVRKLGPVLGCSAAQAIEIV